MESGHVKQHIDCPRVGLIFGKFYPLYRGHIYMIEKASTEVDTLHVMLGCEIERDTLLFKQSRLPRMPTAQDRLRWLKKTFQGQPKIQIHWLDEEGILPYSNEWEA